LTAIGAPNKGFYASEITDITQKGFWVHQPCAGTTARRFHWAVYGTRKDIAPLAVEKQRHAIVKGDGPYTYLA
jgi:hypothetical protein